MGGTIWTSTPPSTTVTRKCRFITGQLFRGTATRFCNSNSDWEPVDYSDCRVKIVNDFIHIWIVFIGVSKSSLESNMPSIINQVSKH